MLQRTTLQLQAAGDETAVQNGLGPGCSAPYCTSAVPETLNPDGMAFQIILANEEAWAKEIAGSQSGAIQGQFNSMYAQ